MTDDRLKAIIGKGHKFASDAAMQARGVPNPTPQQRFEAIPEAARIAVVKAAGSVPDTCGPEIPQAPARGPVRSFQPAALYPDGDDGYTLKPAGFAGRDALARADVFDVMLAQARRRKAQPPFTRTQIAMARDYRALVERHDSAGIRCSSVEGLPGGGGGSGASFIDAVLADGQQIDMIRRRIGNGTALVVRRVRPSAHGARRSIPDRALVDWVCLRDETLGALLARFGWDVKRSGSYKILQSALADALDRMCGPVRGGGIQSRRFDLP